MAEICFLACFRRRDQIIITPRQLGCEGVRCTKSLEDLFGIRLHNFRHQFHAIQVVIWHLINGLSHRWKSSITDQDHVVKQQVIDGGIVFFPVLDQAITGKPKQRESGTSRQKVGAPSALRWVNRVRIICAQ